MKLSLYEIMGEDHYVFAKREKTGEITTTVLDENEKMVFDETSHRFAWESLVGFARMVLKQNEKLEKESL